MDQNLERDTVIELLGRLGNEDDKSVLAAARSLHAAVQEANVDWDDLLLPDGMMEAESSDEDEISDEIAPLPVTDRADSLALIDRLSSNPDVSDALQEELQGYKDDIRDNSFTTSDAAYLKLLAERLKN